MAEAPTIRWADATWNPVRGCARVSPGCEHCYAERLSRRNPSVLGEWGPRGVRVVAAASAWQHPVQWARRHLRRVLRGETEARPLRIFCASLADIFEAHPVVEGVRRRIWSEVLPALDALRLPDGRPAAVLLLLTKRAAVARAWYEDRGCPDTVWPGVSVEDQRRADERLPVMLGLPRLWVSIEPLLGSVRLPAAGLSWVIVGGESGPRARPMDPVSVQSLRDQCVGAGVPFFFKQWGEWTPSEAKEDTVAGPDTHIWRSWTGPDGDACGGGADVSVRCGTRLAGRHLDDREWSELPAALRAPCRGQCLRPGQTWDLGYPSLAELTETWWAQQVRDLAAQAQAEASRASSEDPP